MAVWGWTLWLKLSRLVCSALSDTQNGMASNGGRRLVKARFVEPQKKGQRELNLCYVLLATATFGNGGLGDPTVTQAYEAKNDKSCTSYGPNIHGRSFGAPIDWLVSQPTPNEQVGKVCS